MARRIGGIAASSMPGYVLQGIYFNPVLAGLAKKAQDWRLSSVHANLAGKTDKYVNVEPVLNRSKGRFSDMLETAPITQQVVFLRASETIGRPLGSEAFLNHIAEVSGRETRPARRGRKAHVK